MKGIKHDKEKVKLDLIPKEALYGLGEVLTFGHNKYGRANWANGIEFSRLLSATLRHIAAYNSGEDTDPESGLCHIDHAMCNLAFLSWMRANRADLDDRWAKQVKKPEASVEVKSLEKSFERLEDIAAIMRRYNGGNP